MVNDENPGLPARVLQELTERGHDDLQGGVAEAVGNIGASHAGRPRDEILSVLNQAIHGATGVQGLLSEKALQELTDRVHGAAPHA
jgi:hypothetical protein